MKRGDIYYADLRPVKGSEQGGVRPVVVIQNNIGNHYSPTVIVAALTSRERKNKMPTHVEISGKRPGLKKHSIVLLEQVRTIDRERLKNRIGQLDAETMKYVDHAIAVSFGLDTILSQQEQSDDEVPSKESDA